MGELCGKVKASGDDLSIVIDERVITDSFELESIFNDHFRSEPIHI